MDHQKLGPFTIEKRIGPVNYKLRLPESMHKIHPIVHISLLEKTKTTARLAEDIELEADDEAEYEVQSILDFKRVSGKPYYLVKWKGYSDEENTWEPTENLRSCSNLLHQFRQARTSRT